MSRPLAALVEEFGSPLYVYDEEVLRRACRTLRAAFDFDDAGLLFAMKANSNPELLRIIRDEGFGIDAVSPGEVQLARHCGFPADAISYTGNNASEAELREVAAANVHVTLDAPDQFIPWSRTAADRPFGLRINPDLGGGHHRHVVTGGPDAKFGIELDGVASAFASIDRLGLHLDRLHQHIGSGILDPILMLRAVDALLRVAEFRPSVHCLDFGGGFGIPYRPPDSPFPFEDFGQGVRRRLDRFRRDRGGPLRVLFEPGRSLVGPCGTLLATVTTVKRGSRHTFAGTDSGQSHLLRPALYGAYHRIENLTGAGRSVERITVAGNICESGDLLGIDVPLPRPEPGDVLAIRDVGAYGYSMASSYNLRPRPAEVLIGPGGPRLIRPRETVRALLGLSGASPGPGGGP